MRALMAQHIAAGDAVLVLGIVLGSTPDGQWQVRRVDAETNKVSCCTNACTGEDLGPEEGVTYM